MGMAVSSLQSLKRPQAFQRLPHSCHFSLLCQGKSLNVSPQSVVPPNLQDTLLFPLHI